MTTQPALFIPHGGGPCFFMDPMPGLPPDAWDAMARFLRGIAAELPARPDAILVVSGHWSERVPTLNIGTAPPLLFDYFGFPPHTYALRYPAPGAPALGARAAALLAAAGIGTATESARGYDHGVFIPFLLAFPDADIPILQLSLAENADPARHLAIGAALAALRRENVLIVGSGMSYHNLRELFRRDAAADGASSRFDDWLRDAVEDDPARRAARLAAWQDAPDAERCHPTAEHLLPLLVVAGAAGRDPGRTVYRDTLAGKALSAFRFQSQEN